MVAGCAHNFPKVLNFRKVFRRTVFTAEHGLYVFEYISFRILATALKNTTTEPGNHFAGAGQKQNESFHFPGSVVYVAGDLLAHRPDHAFSFSPRVADPPAIQNRRLKY
jgi:hypothetical protein